MSSIQTEFLYVFVREIHRYSGGKNGENQFRIVYWPSDEYHEACFVIYGKRKTSKYGPSYIPYRISCSTVDQVIEFVVNVVNPINIIDVEVHQFNGENDTSEDEYNIDWSNTAEDFTTNIVRFRANHNTRSGLSSALGIVTGYDLV